MATWTNAGGDNLWSTPDNWYPRLPQAGDAVIFDGTSVADCIMDIDCSVCNFSVLSSYTGHVNASIHNVDAEVGDLVLQGNEVSLGDGVWDIGRHFDYRATTTLNGNNSTILMTGTAEICGQYADLLNNLYVTGTVVMADGAGFCPQASGIIRCGGDVVVGGLFTSVGAALMCDGGRVRVATVAGPIPYGEITGDSLLVRDGSITEMNGRVTVTNMEWRGGTVSGEFVPGLYEATNNLIQQVAGEPNRIVSLDDTHVFTGDLAFHNLDASPYRVQLRFDSDLQVRGNLSFLSNNIALNNYTGSQISFTGFGNDQQLLTTQNSLPELIISKSAGTVILQDDLSSDKLTLTEGRLDAVAAVNTITCPTINAPDTFAMLDFSTADCDVVADDVLLNCDEVYLGDGTWSISNSWESATLAITTWDAGASTVQIVDDATVETGTEALFNFGVDAGKTASVVNTLSVNGVLTIDGILNGSSSIIMGPNSDLRIKLGGELIGTGSLIGNGWTGGHGVLEQAGQFEIQTFEVRNPTATAVIVPAMYESYTVTVHNNSSGANWTPQAGTYYFSYDLIINSTVGGSMTIDHTNDPDMTVNGNLRVVQTSAAINTNWLPGDGNYLIRGDTYLACSNFAPGAGTWTLEGDFDYSGVIDFYMYNTTWEFDGATVLTGTNTGRLRNIDIKADKSVTISSASVGGGVNADETAGTTTISGTLNVPAGTFFQVGGAGDFYLPSTGSITGDGRFRVNNSDAGKGIQQLDGVIDTYYFDYQAGDLTSVFAAGTIGSAVVDIYNDVVADRNVVWNDIEFLGQLEIERRTGAGDLDIRNDTNNPDITLWSHATVKQTGGSVGWFVGTGCIYYVGPGPQDIDWDGLTVETCIVVNKDNGYLIIDGQQIYPSLSGLMITFQVNLYPTEECLGALPAEVCQDLINLNPHVPDDQKHIWLENRFMYHGEIFTVWGAEAQYLKETYPYVLTVVSQSGP